MTSRRRRQYRIGEEKRMEKGAGWNGLGMIAQTGPAPETA
jgi:hypothetical protein